MPIFQSGSLNLAGQLAPGAYVQVVAPPPVVQGIATAARLMLFRELDEWTDRNSSAGLDEWQTAECRSV